MGLFSHHESRPEYQQQQHTPSTMEKLEHKIEQEISGGNNNKVGPSQHQQQGQGSYGGVPPSAPQSQQPYDHHHGYQQQQYEQPSYQGGPQRYDEFSHGGHQPPQQQGGDFFTGASGPGAGAGAGGPQFHRDQREYVSGRQQHEGGGPSLGGPMGFEQQGREGGHGGRRPGEGGYDGDGFGGPPGGRW